MATINGTASGETLQDTAENDTINALGGNDTIYLSGGNDTVNGGDGDDSVYGANAGDVFNGGAGTRDWISLDLEAVLTAITVDFSNAATGTVTIGSTGSSLTQVEEGIIYFGLSNDVITLGTSRISIRPGEGNDTVTGGALADTLYGDEGNDTLNGLGGNDTFYGGDGLDTINGGDGNDAVYGATAGDDFNGGAGDDDWISLDLEDVLTAQTFDLSNAATGTVNIGTTGSSLTQVEDGDIYLGIGNDVVTLGTSQISVRPGDGNDTVTGGALADTLYGNNGNDTLNGLGGNDTFYGEDGLDTINGGDGNDAVYGATAGDDFNGGAGDDDWISLDLEDVLTAQTFDLSNAATGTVNIGTTGSSLTQVEDGIIYLGIGNDVVTLGTSQISIRPGDGNDTVTGGALADLLYGNNGNDTLNGLGGNDTFYGEEGNDVLDGGLGNDSLYADNGNDTASYASITAGSVTIVLSETGTGTHATGAGGSDYYRGIENLTGTSFADALTGNSSANVLNGGGGADTLSGGDGNDNYYVDNAADVVMEAAGLGTDGIFASASYVLGAGQHVETLATTNSAGTGAINLTGNELVNSIVGNNGSNVLNGGAGADTLNGFGGNDFLYVDNAGDVVVEGAGGGSDRVLASVSYALGAAAQVEILSTTNNAGTGAINLTGNGFVNSIVGNNGANVLNGGGGNDTLQGLGGSDTYYVDAAGDVVQEAAGAGTDQVFTSVSYALGAGQHIEVLRTTSIAGTDAINLSGNALANTLLGNAGANVLNGGGGNDTLQGLGGNDTYYVDAAGDVVQEAAGAGTDQVFTSVSYALGAGQHIEALRTTSMAGTDAINLTGNERANALLGNAGANTLDGGGGNDTLQGLGGADTFRFTTALGAGNVDSIIGYVVTDDAIQLDDAVFTGLAAGALAAGAFNTGAAATQADDRIIYNSATGALLFDADGNGAGAAVQFATLDTGLAMTAGEFMVI